MEAALAELGLEDLAKEAEDDKEFFVEKGGVLLEVACDGALALMLYYV